MVTMMVSIRDIGITITATMSRLSVVLPIIACVTVWSEHVGFVDGSGIALAVVAVLLLSTRAAKRGGKVTAWGVLLLALLLLSLGFAQLSLKIFERYCPPHEVTPFVMVLFITATVLTGIWMLAGKSKVQPRDITFGAALGIPNLLTGAFLTLALQEVNGAVVFPVSNVASLFFMALFGVWVWKERLGLRGAFGLALTVIAILLINLG
jgi:drug/metabolite transporter (DMT)-like permease